MVHLDIWTTSTCVYMYIHEHVHVPVYVVPWYMWYLYSRASASNLLV